MRAKARWRCLTRFFVGTSSAFSLRFDSRGATQAPNEIVNVLVSILNTLLRKRDLDPYLLA